jgi:hypothetical protein
MKDRGFVSDGKGLLWRNRVCGVVCCHSDEACWLRSGRERVVEWRREAVCGICSWSLIPLSTVLNP